MIAPLVTKLTDTVEISPTVELNEVPVIIALKLNFFVPDVSKNRLNVASPASSVVKTSANKFAVSLPLAAVYQKSTVPDPEIKLPTKLLDVAP